MRTARSIEAGATRVRTLRTLLAYATLVACMGFVACGGELAAPLPVGSPLQIGSYTLTIQRVQPAPRPGPPISSFREQPGREGVMVFVQWSGLDALDPISRIAFAEEYLEDRLSVVDSTGERHDPTTAMQSALLFMNDPRDNWRDWIVLFHLPEGEGRWLLEVENPEPAEDQPDNFRIDIGS